MLISKKKHTSLIRPIFRYDQAPLPRPPNHPVGLLPQWTMHQPTVVGLFKRYTTCNLVCVPDSNKHLIRTRQYFLGYLLSVSSDSRLHHNRPTCPSLHFAPPQQAKCLPSHWSHTHTLQCGSPMVSCALLTHQVLPLPHFATLSR